MDPTPLKDLNSSQLDFLKERTRQKMVEWAEEELLSGESPPEVLQENPSIFVQYAMEKGWVSKRTPRKLLAGGWKTAAAFLRR